MSNANASADQKQMLGVISIGRLRPGFDSEWSRSMRAAAAEALDSLGFRCVGHNTPVADECSIGDAIEGVRQAGCQALVVLQPSLGNGQLVLTLAQKWENPIVLWATPERPEGNVVSSCSLVAQHLWGSVLRQIRHPFELVVGDPASASARTNVGRAIAVARTVGGLRNSRVGMIGSHAPGFLAMQADTMLMRRELGVQLHRLGLPQFVDRVRGIDSQQVLEDVERVKAMNLPMRRVTTDDLTINSQYYLAMKQLAAEERLHGLAIQCWPELPDLLGQWPYLALARLTGEGHIAALEGDVDGAVTCLVGKLLGTGPGFITDWLEHDAHTIQFWHPGNAPLSMCQAVGSVGGPVLSRHFNIQKPMVVDASLKTDRAVTVARFWTCDGRYQATAIEGRIVAPRRELTGNTALVEFQGCNIEDWFDSMVHAGLPHHPVLFFGSHAESFRRTARALQIQWVG